MVLKGFAASSHIPLYVTNNQIKSGIHSDQMKRMHFENVQKKNHFR